MAKNITFVLMINVCDTRYEYMHNWINFNTQKYSQIECLKFLVISYRSRYSRNIQVSIKQLAQRQIPLLPQILLLSGMTQSILRSDQCIVGVMHALLLNLTKHSLLTIPELSSTLNQWSTFHQESSNLLNNIKKNFELVQVLPLWVSW